MADFTQRTLLNGPICRRKAFSNALGLGLSVEDMPRHDPEACDKQATVASMVFSDVVDINGHRSAMK
jgi:hypothetical protein